VAREPARPGASQGSVTSEERKEPTPQITLGRESRGGKVKILENRFGEERDCIHVSYITRKRKGVRGRAFPSEKNFPLGDASLRVVRSREKRFAELQMFEGGL